MTTSHAPRTRRHRVAVLGATGAVGQAFIRMLADHPWFELTELAASERSAGKTYRDAVHWVGSGAMPAQVAGMTVQACDPASISADIVFSALDSAVAADAEPAFARPAGSDQRQNYRMGRRPSDRRGESGTFARSTRSGGTADGRCDRRGQELLGHRCRAPLRRSIAIWNPTRRDDGRRSGAGYPGVPTRHPRERHSFIRTRSRNRSRDSEFLGRITAGRSKRRFSGQRA